MVIFPDTGVSAKDFIAIIKLIKKHTIRISTLFILPPFLKTKNLHQSPGRPIEVHFNQLDKSPLFPSLSPLLTLLKSACDIN